MKFDINNYKGKYVMHCKTEEEARDFCDYLHSIGRRWSDGKSYHCHTEWNSYKADTVYNFNDGFFCSVDFYMNEDYTILEWEDFMSKEFTKADLKTGDVILHREGAVSIVNRDLEMLIHRDGWDNLDNFEMDLTSLYDSEYDIIAVRRPEKKHECGFAAFERNWGILVYERKEPEEMTLEQVCKLLGKEIKIIQ